MHLKIGKDLDLAYRLLSAGEPIGFPTETVYGLAANAFDEKALLKIFEIKQRPKFDPLIVHCANLADARKIAKSIPEPLEKLAAHFWPGPLTIIVEKNEKIPDLVTAGLPTVGIRVPAHPLALDLLYFLDFPLAAPSANPFMYVSPTSAFHVLAQLGDKIQYVLDGEDCLVGIESTIVRFENNQIEVLRLGGLSVEELQSVSDFPVVIKNHETAISAPGNFKKHYSNGKKIILIEHGQNMPTLKNDEAALYFNKPKTKGKQDFYLTENNDIRLAATQLFAKLRELDNVHFATIYAEKAPNEGLGNAINDRLERASTE